MRDNLPKHIQKYESGIINMDEKKGPGTHWVAYVKKKEKVLYFDSMGHLTPPLEMIKYFRSNRH